MPSHKHRSGNRRDQAIPCISKRKYPQIDVYCSACKKSRPLKETILDVVNDCIIFRCPIHTNYILHTISSWYLSQTENNIYV